MIPLFLLHRTGPSASANSHRLKEQGYASASVGNSQPGKTITPGWTLLFLVNNALFALKKLDIGPKYGCFCVCSLIVLDS